MIPFVNAQRHDADYTAWLSGWPSDREVASPQDYAPGSLPGDGPQFGDVL